MNVAELIARKQDGGGLSDTEITALINGFVDGTVPDYQMSALLMAVYFRGLSDQEGRCFLNAMIRSGEVLSFPDISARKVDKHSTGGVGDKTSLIVAPVLAEAGVPVPMISGRALGHTGGTLDKLESIRGLRVALSHQEFSSILRAHGCVFGAQTDNLVPADKKLYALRDVTSTVAIPPLIAASILSKKIAEGTNALVMDVKIGLGGFLPTEEEARELAQRLVTWSADWNVETIVYGTDMHEPLGDTAGNLIEVVECLSILKNGIGDARLIELCGVLGGAMLKLGGIVRDVESGRKEFHRVLQSGAAYRRFQRIAEAQGADPFVWKELESGVNSACSHVITAASNGVLSEIRPRQIGLGLVELGAGRRVASDKVDPFAGIRFLKKRGDSVKLGEPIAIAHWSGAPSGKPQGISLLSGAFEISDGPAENRPLVYFETA